MKRIAVFASVVLALFAVLGARSAQTQGVANVTIPFGGAVRSLDEVPRLAAARMNFLLPSAKRAGVETLRLQSFAYSLSADADGYTVAGNLFIDMIPVGKTEEFAAQAQKDGVTATINYFQVCRPR